MKFKYLSLILASSVLASTPLVACDRVDEQAKFESDADRFLNDRAGKIISKLTPVGSKSIDSVIEQLKKDAKVLAADLKSLQAKTPQNQSDKDHEAAVSQIEDQLVLKRSELSFLEDKVDNLQNLRSLYEHRNLMGLLKLLHNRVADDPFNFGESTVYVLADGTATETFPNNGFVGYYQKRSYKPSPLLKIIARATTTEGPHGEQFPCFTFRTADTLATEENVDTKDQDIVWHEAPLDVEVPAAYQHKTVIERTYDEFYGICPQAREHLNEFNGELEGFIQKLFARYQVLNVKVPALKATRKELLTRIAKTSIDTTDTKTANAQLQHDTANALKKLESKLQSRESEQKVLGTFVGLINEIYQMLKRDETVRLYKLLKRDGLSS
jgi:hypothetical protein